MSDPYLSSVYLRLVGLLDGILALRQQDPTYRLLSLHEELAMEVVGRRGPMPMSELAQALGLLPSTLTGVVDRLVRQRIVCRESSPKDRRVVLVRLSEHGCRLYKKHQAFVLRHVGRMLQVLRGPERQAFVDLLDRITAQLQS